MTTNDFVPTHPGSGFSVGPPVQTKSIVKLTVNLASEVVNDIRYLAKSRGVTMTEVIRDAIGSEKFIAEHEHCTFLLEDKDGTRRRVVFR